MSTLYELVENYRKFQNSLDEIPEEAIADTLEAIEGEITEKIDAISSIIKQLQSESEAIEAEMKKLRERRDAKDRRAAVLREYILEQMERLHIDKVETARNLVTVGQYHKKVAVDEEQFFRWASEHGRQYISYGKPTPNKIALREAIVSGAEIPFVHIEENRSLRIK